MENRTCPNCGANVSGAKCEFCGAAIPQATAAATAAAPAAVAAQIENLSLWEYFMKCIKNYANFKGRARRKEYWGFVLFQFLIYIGVLVLCAIAMGEEDGAMLAGVYNLGMFVPSLSVLIRRLHDVGKSDWVLLWIFLPIIGWLMLLNWLCKEGEAGGNKYGPNPKSGN